MENRLFRKSDFIVIVAVLVAAGAFLLWQFIGNKGNIAEISVDGRVVETIELDKITDKVTFTPETDPSVVIVAENGKIRFESAECEDKVCVNRGELYRKGDTAVCLPSKTVITIRGGNLDAVTY